MLLLPFCILDTLEEQYTGMGLGWDGTEEVLFGEIIEEMNKI